MTGFNPGMLFRRLILLLLCTSTFYHTGFAVAANDELPKVKIVGVTDLRADASIAAEKQIPILLFFASDYCNYCFILEEEQLKPMLRNREYDDKVLLRRVNLTGFNRIVDFDGKPTTADKLADRYRAPMTPTLVFVSPAGKEISNKMIGVGSMDFYGGELDDNINQALKQIRMIATRK